MGLELGPGACLGTHKRESNYAEIVEAGSVSLILCLGIIDIPVILHGLDAFGKTTTMNYVLKVSAYLRQHAILQLHTSASGSW